MKAILSLSLAMLLTSCLTIRISENDYYAIHNINQSVYLVDYSSGHASGFAVKAASGKTVIMTNDHVCHAIIKSRDGAILYDDNGEKFRTKILDQYPRHDLCILKAPKNAQALELSAKKPQHRSRVFTAGFPIIQIMSGTSGHLLGVDMTNITLHRIPIEKCTQEKYRIDTITPESMGFPFNPLNSRLPPIKVCKLIAPSWVTSLRLAGGASGSPVVNVDGEVLGVVMAVYEPLGFATIVPPSFLKDFLSKH